MILPSLSINYSSNNMDFNTQLLDQFGEPNIIKENFVNDDGENDSRDITLTYLRMSSPSLIGDTSELKMMSLEELNEVNALECLEKRYDLFNKIKENPEKVVLSKEEKDLFIKMASYRFNFNVIVMGQLIKFFK